MPSFPKWGTNNLPIYKNILYYLSLGRSPYHCLRNLIQIFQVLMVSVRANSIPTPFWALGPNLIASLPGPSLMPPLGPLGQVISIIPHPSSHLGLYLVNRSSRSEVIARHYSFSVVR